MISNLQVSSLSWRRHCSPIFQILQQTLFPKKISLRNIWRINLLFSSCQGKVKQGISDTILLSLLNGLNGWKEASHLFSNCLYRLYTILESGSETKTRSMLIKTSRSALEVFSMTSCLGLCPIHTQFSPIIILKKCFLSNSWCYLIW